MKALAAHGRLQTPVPQTLRTKEVARILGTSPARVRAIVRAGLCRPGRHGRMFEFSFQDLVLLRAAHGLLLAGIPARRVRRALNQLSRQLPVGRPLSGVRIYADGHDVAVRAGRTAWQPESGQVVFTFEVDELAKRAAVVVPVRRQRPQRPAAPRNLEQAAEFAFERALMFEEKKDAASARTAYLDALKLDPEMSDAYINLGRLVHEEGNSHEAARFYHLALKYAPDDAVAHYNLALALEDSGRPSAAVAHYQRALQLDPRFADAHFNLGRLLDRLGRRTQAIRHLLSYKKLTRKQ